MKNYSRVLKLAKFRKYWFIEVGEQSEPRKFWKNCVFNHKIWANSEIRTFALPKSGGGTNPLVPPTFESGGHEPPPPPPAPPSPTPLTPHHTHRKKILKRRMPSERPGNRDVYFIYRLSPQWARDVARRVNAGGRFHCNYWKEVPGCRKEVYNLRRFQFNVHRYKTNRIIWWMVVSFFFLVGGGLLYVGLTELIVLRGKQNNWFILINLNV